VIPIHPGPGAEILALHHLDFVEDASQGGSLPEEA
jgi:hypothetical protein